MRNMSKSEKHRFLQKELVLKNSTIESYTHTHTHTHTHRHTHTQTIEIGGGGTLFPLFTLFSVIVL